MKTVLPAALRSKLVLFFWLLVLRLVLEVSYIFILSENFAYYGYALNFDWLRYIFSWALYLLALHSVNVNLLYIKDYFSITFITGLLCPILVLFGLDGSKPLYPVLISLLCFFLILASYKIMNNLFFSGRIRNVKNGQYYAVSISAALVLYLLIWYPISGVTFNLNFADVYALRRENNALSDGGIFTYLNFWVLKVFAVFLLAYCLLKKKPLLVSVMLSVFVFYYAANTHKSVLFTPVLILGIWFYFSKNLKIYVFPMALSSIIILSLVSFLALDDIWLSALFSHRVFFIPSNLTFSYFDFFSQNEFLWYSNSFLSGVVEYPYEKPLVYLMGDYSGIDGSAANNGYISSGYAQGGVGVCVVYSVLIGMMISFIDTVVRSGSAPIWFVLALFSVPMRDFLINMDLLTTILTGGMFWSVVLIYFSMGRARL